MSEGCRRRVTLRGAAVLVLLALLGGACTDGDGDGGAGTPTGESNEEATGIQLPVQVVGAGRVRLFGTFAAPEKAAAESVPGVLVVPTAGTGDRDGLIGPTRVPDRLGADLVTAFTGAGLATYRYDRRGTGESKLEPDTRLAFDDLVADAKAGIDLLAQRKETAGKDVSVVAYDQGGLVAVRLAATDPRVKRLVLISTPRSLLDSQAAALSAQYGPESGEALRAAVAQLLATGTVPPLASLRSELRPLLPPEESAFLAQLYQFDPVAEAAKVQATTLLVVPGTGGQYDPQPLAEALRAEVVTAANAGPTLSIAGSPVRVEAMDPRVPAFEHTPGGSSTSAAKRDTATIGQVSNFLTLAAARRP